MQRNTLFTEIHGFQEAMGIKEAAVRRCILGGLKVRYLAVAIGRPVWGGASDQVLATLL